jgi:hypothetical protein
MEKTMKRVLAVTVLLMIGIVSAGAQKGATVKMLTGKVIDRQDNLLPNAVVYLTDTRTRAVKTYIVSNDGAYRFTALAPNVDYEVYAQYNGKKSDTKMVSQFDNRTQANINLRIDTR